MSNKLPLVLLAALLEILLLASLAKPVTAASDVPPTSVKVPPMVPEQSVSTFVPSETAPDKGLAVNIIYPVKPRYSEGAPLVVVVPGGMTSDGLDFSMHAAQAGFAEVRFAFPGGGKPGLSSTGAFDYRGSQSAQALRDVLLFTAGKKDDYQGRKINKLLPVKVANTNLGLVGWSNGGNLLVITLARFAAELASVKWIAFYESPIGPLFFPPFLGSAQDLVINRHYRQGSCATGDCLVDYRKLAWQPVAQKSPGAHKRIGEPEVKGVLYFDENKNQQWDETSEFAFPYAGYPGFSKQFYPPAILHAIERLKLFEVTRAVKKKKKRPYDESDDEPERKRSLNPFSKKQTVEKKKEEPEKLETVTIFPDEIASVAESERYFQDRDGSGQLVELCKQMPKLLVAVFGSRIDHMQGQPDHPQIAFLYNTFFTNKVWVRLNPDPLYAGQIAVMNARNFIDNAPNSSVDAAQIEHHLEPEGLLPDAVFMDALVAELADRTRMKKLASPLTEPLVNYSNGADATVDKPAGESKNQSP
jgi:hypothetical protein